VQFFWPSRVIAVFPGRDEYRVVSGATSERVFVAAALVFALLFYPVSKVGFDGLIYRMGGAETPYATVVEVLDGDTIRVDTQGPSVDACLLGVDTPETVAPDQSIGCYGPQASDFTRKTLPGKPPDPAAGEVLPTGGAPGEATGRVVKLEVPRIEDSEDAYGRALAYVWVDQDGDGSYEDLLRLGYTRTTSFAHTYSRRFLALEDEAGIGLWGACRTPAE
jgi:endonuclease YncB( thermonuclease family)